MEVVEVVDMKEELVIDMMIIEVEVEIGMIEVEEKEILKEVDMRLVLFTFFT